jgi:hypothetical protein
VNLRFVDWIWHVRGSLALAPEQSSDDAFDRLDPLFRQTGTSRQRTNDMLTFQKEGQAAQDKMSVFDDGVLQIERDVTGSVLRYHLTSRALLFCFLAPLLFLAIAQLTIVAIKHQKPSAEAAKANGKTSHTPKKPAVKEERGRPADEPDRQGLGRTRAGKEEKR